MFENKNESICSRSSTFILVTGNTGMRRLKINITSSSTGVDANIVIFKVIVIM